MKTALMPAPCPIALLHGADAPHGARAMRSGELARVTHGVYTRRSEWTRLAPWDRYLARVHAVSLRNPDAVFCLESACALERMPVFGEPAEVHVLASTTATSRASSGVRVHTTRSLDRVTELGGLLVTAPTATAVDIARCRHKAIGLATTASAARHHGIHRDMLCADNESRASGRGRRHARWAIDRASPIPESTLENVSLAVIEWLGFPPPVPQRWFPGRDDADHLRGDFWWEDARVVGEADGDLKYLGDEASAIDALKARRTRDAKFLERGASAAAHWAWADTSAVRPLAASLVAAGLRPIAPENTAELHALTRLLSRRHP